MKEISIVIAEDDEGDRYFLHTSIEEHFNFLNIKLVNNGEELIDYLNKSSSLPDIIISDINMPKLNGFEVLMQVKNNPRLSDIPFILYSTTVIGKDKFRAEQLGAVAIIQKPKDFNGYVQVWNQVIDFATLWCKH